MAETAKKTKLTHSDYFTLEEKSETRHEYYQGEIFDLAGGSYNHAAIISNIIKSTKFSSNSKNCKIFSTDLRVGIKTSDLFTYPDILIICGQPEFYEARDDTVLNPVFLAEVLSESTKNYDRGEKFLFYRKIPSLKHYLLIDQYTIHVEYFRFNEQGHWSLSEYSKLADRLEMVSPDFSLSLKEIYQGVEFKHA